MRVRFGQYYTHVTEGTEILIAKDTESNTEIALVERDLTLHVDPGGHERAVGMEAA